jgi:arsenate reductase (thioredoxin)
MDPIRVIFVCVANSARSQMAEAILRREGGGRFEVVSAGVEASVVNPLTIRALSTMGIDISDARSKSVNEFVGQPFDYVITVCDPAREACPYFPGGRKILHWSFDDPAQAEGTEVQRQAVFERVMGEIADEVAAFIPLATPARAAETPS